MLQTFLQTFQKSICRIYKMEMLYFQFVPGTSFCQENGFYEKGHPECMADFHFYRVMPGDRIECRDSSWQFQLSSYSEETEEYLIYTYCYQTEENWAKYRGDFTEEGWRTCQHGKRSYKIEQGGWIRIAVRKKDGTAATAKDAEAAKKSLLLCRQKEKYEKKNFFKDEIKKTVETVRAKKKSDSLVFGLMTDTHYVINGGWEDSISNLIAVHKKVKLDAMVHLGDLTDGMLPLDVTKKYSEKVMKDLQSLRIPVYLTLGNHDSNYFKLNQEWMTPEEQSQFYLKREKPWYTVDFEKQKLRCMFLFSFNHQEEIRYGFPQEEVEWVKRMLNEVPDGYSILIFSHVPLLPEMHYWSNLIRNCTEMKNVLDQYVHSGGIILAYIHGHNHSDQILYTECFPIISIGCAKCEDFKDKKPEGSVTFERKKGTLTQELWDVLVINTEEKKMEFVRFGAGNDRIVQLTAEGLKEMKTGVF